jgi:acetolactate synthase-1/2/3 large subunit
MKYSDAIFNWLKASGFTHCYFVAGGNIMHLLNSARLQMVCVPTVHEVAAVIAAEYHNATLNNGAAASGVGRALAMVTAGPGLTNAVTGLAGAFLESRELLLLGGQVKVQDLAPQDLRQLGIQEVDGVAVAAPLCKRSLCLREPLDREAFLAEVSATWNHRPGPVFLELPLDVQAVAVPAAGAQPSEPIRPAPPIPSASATLVEQVADRMARAERPLLLLGGGLSRPCALRNESALGGLSLPIMTTWNGADRYGSDHSNYFGRPNTWGQRYSNLLLQQADLLVAVGTRLGLQQTGFNWQSFLPVGKLIQVDIDAAELGKPNPLKDLSILADADQFLSDLLKHPLGSHPEWLSFCAKAKASLPLSESCNITPEGFLNPFDMVAELSDLCGEGDHIVPCSSGGAFTVMMQAFNLRQGQTMLTDKGLASMGYGLSGAIGAAIAAPGHRTVLVEGDGGFTQNLQELATVAVQQLDLKIFLFCNEGYASIRMTQKNYFDGSYIGCDVSSGLGFPDWQLLCDAYGIAAMSLLPGWSQDQEFLERWHSTAPTMFLVPIHPEQTYFPKISSRISANGGMESNPLHLMSPELPPDITKDLLRYLPMGG